MTGLESKASRARARRQWRTAAAAFRQWRQRGRVAACARRALAAVGKHRAFDRTTAWPRSRRGVAWRRASGARRTPPPRASRRARTPSQRASARWTRRSRKGRREAAGRRARGRGRARRRGGGEAPRAPARARGGARARRRIARTPSASARAPPPPRPRASPPLGASPRAWRRRRAAPRVAAADAAAEREWLRVALEKAWAEVLAYRRRAGARDADASLHEHLASVAGEAWADELAKALVPPAAGTARAMLGDGCASAATRRDARDGEETRETKKSSLLAKTKTKTKANEKPAKRGSRSSVSRAPNAGVTRGRNPPVSIGRVVGVARRDFVSVPGSAREKEETRVSAAARLTPAWRAPSAADPSPLAARRRDREAARERARARREGRFGDRGHSTRAASSPWTPKSLRVSSRAASLLGLDSRTRELGSLTGLLGETQTDVADEADGRFRLSLPYLGDTGDTNETKVDRRTYAGAASPTRATLAARERRSDAAWETSRARFALSREAFREAVAQRQKKNDEMISDERQTNDAAEDAMDKSAASYSVQTPGGTTSETTSEQKIQMSRLSVAGAEGGALALGRRRRGGLCPGTRTRTRTGRPARATSTSGCFARASFPRSRHVVTFVVVRARYSYRRAAETCSRKPSKLSKNFERVDCWVIVRRHSLSRSARWPSCFARRATRCAARRLRRARRRLGAA